MSIESAFAAAPSDIMLTSVEIDDAGPSCKRMTIEVSAETVDSRLDSTLLDIASQAALPGFRPGKAPRKLVERRLGKQLNAETTQKLVSDAYQKAVSDNGLQVLGDPVLKNDDDNGGEDGQSQLTVEPGQAFSFTVEVEIVPEIEVPTFEDLEVRRPIVEITDDVVNEELERQRNRFGEIKPLTGDPGPGTLFGGVVTIYNLEGDQPEAIAKRPDAMTRWPLKDSDGQGALGGILIDDIAKHLKGKGRGDVITIETEGPDNHEVVAIRGNKVRIEFEIEELGEQVPLEEEELVAKLGCADAEDLRNRIRDAMRAKIEGEQRDVMHRQVVRYLMDKIDMDLPGRMTEAQAERNLQRARLEMLQRNVPEYMIEERLGELRSASDEQARRDLKMHFIMEKLASDYQIGVEEAEVNAKIFQIAREQGERPDAIRESIIKSGSGSALVTQIRHEKTADRILEQVEVQDVTVEEWNELMAEEEGDSGADDGAAATSKKKTSKKKKKTTKKSSKKKKKTTKKASSTKKADDDDSANDG